LEASSLVTRKTILNNDLRERLINFLLVLLIILAALFLAQMIWQLVSGYADLVLLFVLGWLVSFVLNPIVFELSGRPIPRPLERFLKSVFGEARAKLIIDLRLSRAAAVIIVYLVLVLAIVLSVALFVPTAVVQLSQLARRVPEYTAQLPQLSAWAQDQLARVGIRLNIEQAVQSGLGSLQTYVTAAIQNALGILTSVLGLLANLFFVLIISFIMTMDGPRLRHALVSRIPQKYHDDIHFFSQSVDHTFGGFLRGQLLQAILVLMGTAVAMTVLGLNYVLVASLFAGLLMLIPLIGPFLALIPPLIVVMLQTPELTLWLILALFIYQFVISNVLMPRVLSDSLGLHPLLVFASILVSVRVAGFWGAFFGIPVAGVLWAMALSFFERWQRQSVGNGEQGDE
jgi:predicted PurR-regulated permease PerM